MLLFQAVFLLLHPLLECVPHGTLPPAGDGDAGPAAHAQLPGRKQVRLGQIDHIGAVGLQKAPSASRGCATAENGTRSDRVGTSSPLVRWKCTMWWVHSRYSMPA